MSHSLLGRTAEYKLRNRAASLAIERFKQEGLPEGTRGYSYLLNGADEACLARLRELAEEEFQKLRLEQKKDKANS